ncbi:MAG TPA: 16S rRNA (cytidine(1402)-2'-O)-methyltransferase, partial [Acidimicrobiaceae bacterium]|nr:16S rRNA (cytidine(1402)-2'-O)-methyltransferase [Acidimicrobiaceae bacterium]
APGTRLVAAAAAAGCRVTIVPGPSAPAAALAVSGLAALPHVFEGWLPRAGAARRDRIARIAAEPRTVVLLESPRRVAATLAELAEACGGDRRCAVVRELTKLHEEVVRATLAAAAAHFGGDDAPRGEFVVVIGPRPPTVPTDADITTALAAEQAAGATRRAAVDAVAASLDVARNRVYGLALAVPRPSD